VTSISKKCLVAVHILLVAKRFFQHICFSCVFDLGVMMQRAFLGAWRHSVTNHARFATLQPLPVSSNGIRGVSNSTSFSRAPAQSADLRQAAAPAVEGPRKHGGRINSSSSGTEYQWPTQETPAEPANSQQQSAWSSSPLQKPPVPSPPPFPSVISTADVQRRLQAALDAMDREEAQLAAVCGATVLHATTTSGTITAAAAVLQQSLEVAAAAGAAAARESTTSEGEGGVSRAPSLSGSPHFPVLDELAVNASLHRGLARVRAAVVRNGIAGRQQMGRHRESGGGGGGGGGGARKAVADLDRPANQTPRHGATAIGIAKTTVQLESAAGGAVPTPPVGGGLSV
jgi:hypothetical protein